MDTFRMPVDLKIETEGNPEQKRMEVVGTSSEFSVDTFGKPKNVIIDPDNRVLRFKPGVRVAVAIRRGEQFAEAEPVPRSPAAVSEGAREPTAPARWRTIGSPRSTSRRTTTNRPPTSSARR